MYHDFMARRYELGRRAEQQEETRRRIVAAAVELHGSVGVANTTVTEIADRAGVGRQTFYRHFPDELSLVRACSGLYWERYPWPDPEQWESIADPDERFHAGLTACYAYHRRTEGMIGGVLRDAPDHPVVQGYHRHWDRIADGLTAAWRLRGKGRTLLRAAVGHAVVFPTWYSLVREQGLSDQQAVALMERLTREC